MARVTCHLADRFPSPDGFCLCAPWLTDFRHRWGALFLSWWVDAPSLFCLYRSNSISVKLALRSEVWWSSSWGCVAEVLFVFVFVFVVPLFSETSTWQRRKEGRQPRPQPGEEELGPLPGGRRLARSWIVSWVVCTFCLCFFVLVDPCACIRVY